MQWFISNVAFETESTVMAVAFMMASVAGMKCGMEVCNEKTPLAIAATVQHNTIRSGPLSVWKGQNLSSVLSSFLI